MDRLLAEPLVTSCQNFDGLNPRAMKLSRFLLEKKSESLESLIKMPLISSSAKYLWKIPEVQKVLLAADENPSLLKVKEAHHSQEEACVCGVCGLF